MIFLLDTACMQDIFDCYEIFKITGITTNPSIVAKMCNQNDNPYIVLNDINNFAVREKIEFHVQVNSITKESIIDESYKLNSMFGDAIYIKIPVTKEGLKAIGYLSEKNFKITATAIYSYAQALFAYHQGAENLAIYCNRMEDIGVDFRKVIHDIKVSEPHSRILCASFKSFSQVKEAILSGADACTVQPNVLISQIDQLVVKDAIKKFNEDWAAKALAYL